MQVLAIGATGQYAGLVVPALAAKGLQVRALVHDPAKADRVSNLEGVQIVGGDLRDRASIDAALKGVDAVFHVTPAFAADTVELGVGMVEAATAAGVGRFVFSSVYHPSLSLVNHASMHPIEEALYRSPLAFTVLQPAMFMQGLAGSWATAREHGIFTAPYSKDSPMSFVDYRDVAEVAAIALSGDELAYGTFELAAGGVVTRTEIAAMMSRHAGRTVVAQDVDPEVALANMPAGAMRDGLTAMFRDYTAHGFRGGNNLVLRTILGRTPRTLDDYLGELAA
ncbi:NmrA family NAD(P)-binding protein [Nocardia sp. NPDC088792]|uniref:NmrA family NAD(P)-binding protein n=1 Tax=Nocardia sp. NPDC088792 TaxID=3364332 RepID=UPI003813C793